MSRRRFLALSQRQLQLRPSRSPDPLAVHAIGQGLQYRAAIQIGHHRLLGPNQGVAVTQLGPQSMPEFRFTHEPNATTRRNRCPTTAKTVSASQHNGCMRSDPATALAGFSVATQAWFAGAFTAPTPAQTAAWQAIRAGQHALVVAPTGSGKTLAAFLHSLDRLAASASTGKVRVLYISPLKALAVDVERNLRVPLRGMQDAARALGLPEPTVRVAVRSGDTPTNERQSLRRNPPEILITTPESLFLILSSAAAETLSDVETVIVDEVHALAGTKRGAHLGLSLERLGGADGGPQRIGLSATVNPAAQAAAFLAGDRPVQVIEAAAQKDWDLSVVVPVAEMTQLRKAPDEIGAPTSNSIWPWVEPRILELIDAHRSTICFVNSRRVAERLTGHLNELHAARLGVESAPAPLPADYIAQSGASQGHDGTQVPVIARAHHGSVSKQRRLEIESDLKAGRLPCVVATASLELGIDMGAVDLVIQVQAPASVSSALQRIGRAGHDVGATSKGVVFPTARGDLLECAVIVDQMQQGRIEPLARLSNPLDVLAQQLVSICLAAPRSVDDLFSLVRRADAYRELSRPVFDSVVDMLCGRYPSEEFGELRPRLARDRATGVLSARPGARMLVTTSGGTIPDRGAFGVFLAGAGGGSGRGEPGRRVGELDEEMVYETRVGDVFTLGTTSWRVDEITSNHVLVTPAPGAPGRLPFWRGDSLARPLQLGQAIGELAGRLAADPTGTAADLRAQAGLDDSAVANLVGYVSDQLYSSGVVPDDRTIVVERLRDELGDWRVCVLASRGSAVLAPLAMALRHMLRQRYGSDPEVVATNDGIILRIPDVDAEPPGAELLTEIEIDRLSQIVEAEVGVSSLFAARFRESAARALLLPRRRPGMRSPLWQQRLRASQLLQVARNYPDFPIVLETMRECLHDVFDLPALVDLLHQIAARQVRVVAVETEQPSPFAQHLLFNYSGNYIYNDDQPAAERRLAALSLDAKLLDELLGRASADEFFDQSVIDQVTAELQRTAPGWQATDLEEFWDLLRTSGPLTSAEWIARAGVEPAEAQIWLDQLRAAGRVEGFDLGSEAMLVVSEDADWLGSWLPGRAAPPAVLDRLIERWAARRAITTAPPLAARFGTEVELVAARLDALVAAGTLVRVQLTPGEPSPQFCHRAVLERIRRRMLAKLRAGVEPADHAQFARFCLGWHELGSPGLGVGGLVATVDQLAGVPVPASMLETIVLPARVADYRPAMLDELLADGSVRWTGHGQIGDHDGWVQLWPGEIELPALAADLDPTAQWVAERLAGGGAWRPADLAAEQFSQSEIQRALWQLAWAGLATTDSFAAVREWGGQKALRRIQPPRPRRRLLPRAVVQANPAASGVRWAGVPRGSLPATDQLVQDVSLLLARHGVVSKPAVNAEPGGLSFAQIYQLLSRLEERGTVRRGYFVDGLGGAQFALPGAVDRLRDQSTTGPVLLAACDPANPYGAALAWPQSPAHRPNRGAGSLVMLDDGALIAYLERGARTLLAFTGPDDARLAVALELLAETVSSGRLDELTIERINGLAALEAAEFFAVLGGAGFVMVPQGFRRRRG